MTPKISLVTAVAGAALLLAVPAAWGKGQLPTTAPDVLERAAAAHQRSTQSSPITMPDVVDRAVAARADGKQIVFDGRFPEPVNVPVATSTASSGRDIEWSQIGLGFGVGILLALGAGLATRYVRTRPLAHG